MLEHGRKRNSQAGLLFFSAFFSLFPQPFRTKSKTRVFKQGLNAEPLAGVTSHFPTWRELVWMMFNELYPLSPEASVEEVQEREKRFIGKAVLRIASEYEASFGRQKLEELIRQQTPDADYCPSSLHSMLLNLPWVDVFTTNYDTLLEKTEIPGRTYQPVIKASELTRAFSPRIVKLHGSFPSQTPFIITEEDYRTYPADFAPFVNSVRQSLLENSFVLIGFSGDDPNFLAWTGWIRDELGDHHAPIYLVGLLNVGDAERSLLGKRGVTPIDLAPLFDGIHPPRRKHAVSLEWFFQCLAAASPPKNENWPEFNRYAKESPLASIPLVFETELAPPRISSIPEPGKALTLECVHNVIKCWKYERTRYPGWLVADEAKRSLVWEKTKYWIDPILLFTKKWPLPDQIIAIYEINWRLELAIVPLFTHWMERFENVVEQLYDSIISNSIYSTSFHKQLQYNDNNVVDAWIVVSLALLREARETNDINKWSVLKTKMDVIVVGNPQHKDSLIYEAALLEMWSINRLRAKDVLAQWRPPNQHPLAMMRKAGMLAELDELNEAASLLHDALSSIRKGLRRNGRNIELLSLEGWCMYLLFAIQTVLNPANRLVFRNEYLDRWQELKAWDCSPWPQKEYFDKILAGAPPQPSKSKEIIREFDPGRITISYHLGGPGIDPFLPAFALLRLYEYIGLPMRIPFMELSGNVLINACHWIAPLSNYWSPAIIIRVGKADAIKKGQFLKRTSVAQMDVKMAIRFHAWCLQIIQREIDGISGPIAHDSSEESLFKVLPEVLSRLAFRVDDSQLEEAFKIAIRLCQHNVLGSNSGIYNVCETWFRRLFEAAEGARLLEWLPLLLEAPLNPFQTAQSKSFGQDLKEPMLYYPEKRIGDCKKYPEKLVTEVQKAAEWLIKKSQVEEGEVRRRAIIRLISIRDLGLLTYSQQSEIGLLIWRGNDNSGLPDLPYNPFSFLHMPSPPGISVSEILKKHFLAMPIQIYINRDDTGKVIQHITKQEHELILYTYAATKPLVQLDGEHVGTLEWTSDESKQMFIKAKKWWHNDKEAVKKEWLFENPVVETLKKVGDFISRVVIPNITASDPEWKDLNDWLVEIRDAGAYPTVALPYLVYKQSDYFQTAAELILKDLNSISEEAVSEAARAIRHWINLSVNNIIQYPPAELLSKLIERVCLRRRLGLKECIYVLMHLILEQPQMVSEAQGMLLIAGLTPWHEETILPVPVDDEGGFQEDERPGYRESIGGLAGALFTWFIQSKSDSPEPSGLVLWRTSCEVDPLPEVRRAFAICASYKANKPIVAAS